MSLFGRQYSKWIQTTHRHVLGSPARKARLYWERNIANLTTTDAQRKTIYALSTPPGKGGVAIVRVSGPDALHVWKRMARSHKSEKPLLDPAPWKMQRCRIVHPESEMLIDDGLAVYFKAPYSYTTLPTLELHIHSGRALISALLSALSSFPSLRPAEPGEFTRQALLGGRLDLTQVEGLHDLIEADTEVQRLWALGSAGGETRAEYDSLRTQIIHCLAQVEALIDFGEGEDIEEGVYEQARAEAADLLAQIRKHLSDNRRGELVRSGIKMAIFGPPNAGKSSLFNYLANRPASIVTSIPGTTRDVIELTLDIGGLPVVVADTAGLRETHDVVEVIGVQRGLDAIKNADISLCVLPLSDVLFRTSSQGMQTVIPSEVKEIVTPTTYFLFNKSDLVPPSQRSLFQLGLQVHQAEEENMASLQGRSWIASLATGEGSHEFVQGLAKSLKSRFDIHDPNSSQQGVQSQSKLHGPIITRARHRVHLESACKFLEAFLVLRERSLPSLTALLLLTAAAPEDVVIAAEELRYAAQAVGRVTGDIGVEDVLDSLFKDFCIGK
ncbi:tRNA modification GTPase TrmE [Gymnopilus junonius]|uniref:tRNA modification GTPase TrmE n=1 Tax=Gymnopilus junonius TaxID=109634 RepID=A0A9P5TFY5_GYMJU|nr:tRNA modification GTPase TrmE [Gymnopilus junonius]